MSYNLRIIQEYRQKHRNIQPGPEKQHSYKKKRVYTFSEVFKVI